jgi:FkbM family methyltransferase
MTDEPLVNATESVLVRHADDLNILDRIADYPHVASLIDNEQRSAFLSLRKTELNELISDGIYIFGAYKVGGYIAVQAAKAKIQVKGFLDNDKAKRGSIVEGLPVAHPADIDLTTAVVVVGSGHHSNQIIDQLSGSCRAVLNMSEFLYATDSAHGPEKSFASVVHEPLQQPYRYLSVFLRLSDERSRQVFNSLIGMRTTLSIQSATETKSPYQEEYFDKEFVTSEAAGYFVDAGAYTGDTLASLERHFGPVKKAYLFEPELPPYYEALKRFSDRKEVLVFNLGLDCEPSRCEYRPELTCDSLAEIRGPISPDVVSFIQGVPLDSLVHGRVGLFKLDIEGMEAQALQGACEIIKREKPVLAVCAYHLADDYWKLIDVVSGIRSDYKIAIRHYADILHDITLYFY